MMIVVCEKCGSNEVESKVWYNHQTGKTEDFIISEDPDDNWCKDCQEHVKLEMKET